jgi:hypothetical protein
LHAKERRHTSNNRNESTYPKPKGMLLKTSIHAGNFASARQLPDGARDRAADARLAEFEGPCNLTLLSTVRTFLGAIVSPASTT